MKAKLFAAAAATFLCVFAHAATKTWTGAADPGDGLWSTADNWSPSGAPGVADDVTIDGATVTVSGDLLVPKTLTLLNGAKVEASAEIKFGFAYSEHPVIYGGTVSGTLVASQRNGATLTISDATVIETGTGSNGFYQNGVSYLNFVDGAARASKFIYKTSLGADPFTWSFSNNQPNNPYFRYDDQILSRADFDANFQYVANQDGTTTLSMKVLAGWRLGTLSVGEVANGRVSVSVTATKHSGNASATVYFAQGNHDYGESFAAWPTKTAGIELSASDTVQDTLSLDDGNNCIRAFLLCEGDYTATAPVFRRILAYGDYGTLTDVYEYIGTDDNLADPANWAKDKVAPAAAAPTAGTDIRWFGRNTDYSGVLSITDKDRFDGATLHLTGDCNVSSDVVFSNSTVSIAMIVVTDPVVFSLYGSDLTTTGTYGWLGVYPPEIYPNALDKRFVNFLSGKTSSFTFAAGNGVSDATTAKSVLVAAGYLVLDGAAITDEQWETYFDVDVAGTAVTVSYNPTVADNRIASVEASDISSASATLSATIIAIEDGASLVVACDTDEITEQNVVAKGAAVVPAAGTATAAVSGLTPYSLHHFAFAIVKDGAVLAFRSGTFFASEFKYVWRNDVWLGATPASLDTTDSVLILSPYNNGTGDTAVWNTVVSNATLSCGTLKGSKDAGAGPMKVVSSAIVNGKQNDLGAICGTWGGTSGSPYLDFSSSTGNGTIRRACSYTFNATEGWLENAYTLLFGEERIHLNGAKVSEATYESQFTLVTNSVAETGDTPYNVTLTYWEPFPERTVRDWTIEDGARVKLVRYVSLDSVTVESNDVSIDLNGFDFRAVSMTTNGVPLKGKYTSATLPILKGEGLLEVGIRPTFLLIR